MNFLGCCRIFSGVLKNFSWELRDCLGELRDCLGELLDLSNDVSGVGQCSNSSWLSLAYSYPPRPKISPGTHCLRMRVNALQSQR